MVVTLPHRGVNSPRITRVWDGDIIGPTGRGGEVFDMDDRKGYKVQDGKVEG